jgi:hypothetical protein
MTNADIIQQSHPPDAGEPQGSRDLGRPAMLGRRFRQTVAAAGGDVRRNAAE